MAETISYEDYPFSDRQQKGAAQTAAIRQQRNHKIIALIIENNGELLLNLKLTPPHVTEMAQTRGVTRGYHMNKTHWVSVAVNATDLTQLELTNMIAESNALTKK